jgi:hypothetical protein
LSTGGDALSQSKNLTHFLLKDFLPSRYPPDITIKNYNKKLYERPVLIHTHSWKLAAGLLHTKSKYTDFLPHYQFIFENKILCLSIQTLHTWFPLISICVILFLDIGMQVGGRARESPKTGDSVRATKIVCCTIRISLTYRGHGDPLKNYQCS